jgi:hypothetical protein
MNEYDIIETHEEDGNYSEDTKTVEKEVLLHMTNLDSKTNKLGRKIQEDSKNKVKYFCIMSYNL